MITGGTGLVGSALAGTLVKKGYRVIILTRNPPGSSLDKGIRYARWDVRKGTLDPDALRETDHIIHLAGAGVVDKKWTQAYKEEIVNSRVNSSALIIDQLKKNPHRVKTVISASATGFYGPDQQPGHSFIETDKAATDFLGDTCRLWEESIQPVAEMGIRLVKLRIGIVLSPDGGALKEFMKPIRFGIAAILGNGRQVVSWIHIDDLCSLFLFALENDHTSGAYNAVAPEPVTNKALMTGLAGIMRGRFYIPFPVPAFILRIMMGNRSIEVLKSATVSSTRVTRDGFQFRFPQIKAALKDLLDSTGQRS